MNRSFSPSELRAIKAQQLGYAANETRGTLPLVGASDGGLQRRMMFREVRDRVITNQMTGVLSTACGLCVEHEAKNVRRYVSWDGMRNHLISYHGEDPREVPE